MKKRCFAFSLLVIALFIIGCAQQQQVPEPSCRAGYILSGDACCRDQNGNSECDEDEDTLFAPSYAPKEEEDIVDMPEPEYLDAEETEEHAEPEPEPKILDVPEDRVYVEPDEPDEPEVDYAVMQAELDRMSGLQDWSADNGKMGIEITKIILEVNEIVPRDRLSPDKEVILKEVHFDIKNLKYNYMNFELLFRIQDENDPLIVKEILKCSTDDDFPLEGCRQGFREGDVLNIRMTVDEKIPRIDMDKTFRFILENIRDSGSWNAVELSKTVDVLEIEGAEYI